MARRKRRLGVAGLLALDLSDDRETLSELAMPEASALVKANARELREAAEHFGALGARLAREDLGGGAWFWGALRAVGTYFGFSLYELALKARPAVALEVLQEVDAALREEKAVPGSMEADLQRTQAEEVLGTFAFCASKLLIAADIDEMEVQVGQLTEKYDADLTAVSALETFHEEIVGLDAEPLEVADDLLALSFRFRRITVKERFKRWSRLREVLPLVGVKELTMLGQRHAAMVDSHGEKRVERVFEQKLNVVFQALGFTVVSARPGEAAADLLCISKRSPDPKKHFSFLVDAKSSRNPYKLPKADWRAIVDYVREKPELIAEIPPLAFVLVVGSEPAATLPARMKELGDEVGIPVRFSGASLIALLHQALAAPVPPQAFRDAVRQSAPVLSETLVDEMKAAREKGTDKMAEFYRKFRDLEI